MTEQQTNNDSIPAADAKIRLEFSDGRPPLSDMDDINRALANYGARIWPMDLNATAEPMRALLSQVTLTTEESAQVRDHFVLSRERLLQLITEAGRKPQAPGGGEMSTLDATNNVTYPQLYIVGAGVDYSRFDKFHVNAAPVGTGVDEILQLLSGGPIRVLLQIAGEGLVTLHLASSESTGWIATYDGGHPHIGSLTGGTPGTKLLVQVIGPPSWVVQYKDA